MPDSLWLGAQELERLIPDDIVRRYLAENLHRTLVAPPVRVVQPDGDGTTIVMAAGTVDHALSVVKVLYERPGNRALSAPKPTLNGSVTLYNSYGDVMAVVDGAAFTGIRTAAIAAVSTTWLAASVQRQALIGSGLEAYYHAKALATLSGVREMRLWARHREAAEVLAARLRALPQFQDVVVQVDDHIQDAVKDADVITTVTASPLPLLTKNLLPHTVLINAMGSYQPTTRELASDVVKGAHLYADALSSCVAEAGDYVIPAQEGLIDLSAIRPLTAAAHDGAQSGRTVMKSVGTALFDVICAECLVHRL